MAVVTRIYYTTDDSLPLDSWNVSTDQTDDMELIGGLTNDVPVTIVLRNYDNVTGLYSPPSAPIVRTPYVASTTDGPGGSSLVTWARPSPSNVGAGITGAVDQTLAHVSVPGAWKWRSDGAGFEFQTAGTFTFDNYMLEDAFLISKSDVTLIFNNCHFTGNVGGNTLCGFYWITRNLSNVYNVKIICNDCTFEKFGQAPIQPQAFWIEYHRCVLMRSGGDGSKCGPATVFSTSPLSFDRQPFKMVQCYVGQIADAFYNVAFNDPDDPLWHQYTDGSGSATIHGDACQADDMQEVDHLTLIGNYIDCPAPWVEGGMVSDGADNPDYADWHMGGITALAFITARNMDVIGDAGSPTFLIEGNWLNGGNYCIQVSRKGSHPYPTGGLIRNNLFYHGYGSGMYLDPGSGQTYNNNQFQYGGSHPMAGTIVNCDAWLASRGGWPAPLTL